MRTPLNATERTLPNRHLTQNEHERWPKHGSEDEAMEQIADFGAEELIDMVMGHGEATIYATGSLH